MKEKLLALGMSTTQALLCEQLYQTLSPQACWQKISTEILTPEHAFEIHQFLFTTIYPDWQENSVPVWMPTSAQIAKTNLTKCMELLKIQAYEDFYTWSIQEYEKFLSMMLDQLKIRFGQAFEKIVDLSNGVASPNWFLGAKLNIVDSCFQASADKTAIIYKNHQAITENITYQTLEKMVNRFANSLVNHHLKSGDAVAIIMEMRPETIIAYLGAIKAGCIVVSIPDSFSVEEIQKRLMIGNVKAVFTQDFIAWHKEKLNIYQKIIDTNAPFTVVIPYEENSLSLREGDKTWLDFLDHSEQFVSVLADPGAYTNILFSSGTTGVPKGIPWTHTTPIKCAIDGFLHHDIQAGDIFCWPTNLGWMMGPWVIYATLINQATLAIYEGSPIDAGFGQFIQESQINLLGLVPSIVKSWRETGCLEKLDLTHIKLFSSSGEPSHPEDMLYLMSRAGYKPIIEYCGGTEIGGAYITNTLLKPQALARFNTPALGSAFTLIDSEVALIPPAIGLSTTLINKDHYAVYFAEMPLSPEGKILRRHGDALSQDSHGFYRMLGRTDDTMKLNGIKTSAIEIENVLEALPVIEETAAIAVTDLSGGPSKLVIYAVLKTDQSVDIKTLKTQMQKLINTKLNPFFKIHEIILINQLPRTDSNKIQRRKLREQFVSMNKV